VAEKKGSASGVDFEVYYSDFKISSIKNTLDLEKAIKKILFDFNNYRETYPIIDNKSFLKENEDVFKVNSKKSDLITFPKKEYFQIIQTHVASEASYNFNYFDDDLPLDVEYKNFENWNVVASVKQKNKDIQIDMDTTGATLETKVILGYRDQSGKEKYRFVAGQFAAGFYYEDEGLDDDVDAKVKTLSEIWYENLIN
jgi:hypothetical protein